MGRGWEWPPKPSPSPEIRSMGWAWLTLLLGSPARTRPVPINRSRTRDTFFLSYWKNHFLMLFGLGDYAFGNESNISSSSSRQYGSRLCSFWCLVAYWKTEVDSSSTDTTKTYNWTHWNLTVIACLLTVNALCLSRKLKHFKSMKSVNALLFTWLLCHKAELRALRYKTVWSDSQSTKWPKCLAVSSMRKMIGVEGAEIADCMRKKHNKKS